MALSQLIASLLESTESYSQTSLKLLEMKARKSAILTITWMTWNLVLAGLVFIFFFFTNVGVALWLGFLWGKPYLGFLGLGIFYLLICFLLRFYLKDSIGNWTAKIIIKKWKKMTV